jgi:hypothetical protein
MTGSGHAEHAHQGMITSWHGKGKRDDGLCEDHDRVVTDGG